VRGICFGGTDFQLSAGAQVRWGFLPATDLEVAQLSKLLPAIIQLTGIRLALLMSDLVGSDVAALGESLVTDFAFVGLFASVSALMGLQSD